MNETTIDLLKLMLQLLGTLGMSGFITFFVTRKITKNEQKRDNIREERERSEKELCEKVNKLCEANVSLLRDLIWNICSRVEEREYFTAHEYEQISEAFPIYERLGGNGITKKKVESDIQKYPVRDE